MLIKVIFSFESRNEFRGDIDVYLLFFVVATRAHTGHRGLAWNQSGNHLLCLRAAAASQRSSDMAGIHNFDHHDLGWQHWVPRLCPTALP